MKNGRMMQRSKSIIIHSILSRFSSTVSATYVSKYLYW